MVPGTVTAFADFGSQPRSRSSARISSLLSGSPRCVSRGALPTNMFRRGARKTL